MLTVREVMKALSHEQPDSPAKVRVEKLHYNSAGKLILKDTEIENVPVSAVVRKMNGDVVIE